MTKSLQEKAISIQGKDYVLVSDRIIFFNEVYSNGSITTDLLSPYDSELVVVKATVTPDISNPDRKYTGYSQAKWGAGFINKTSALENAETSAVGRALAMMGIGVIDSIASVDEVQKAKNAETIQVKTATLTDGQRKAVYAIAKQNDWLTEDGYIEMPDVRPFKVSDMTSAKASGFIAKYGKKADDNEATFVDIYEQ